MLRAILGVLAGFFTTAILVILLIFLAVIAFGMDAFLKPGTYEVKITFTLTALGIGFVVAIVGGFVCAMIARRGSSAPIVLATLILVFGAIEGVAKIALRDPDVPTVRPAEQPFSEAEQFVREPVFYLILNPLVGALGIMTGAKLRGGAKDTNAR